MAPASTGPGRDAPQAIRARAAQWSAAERCLDAERAASLAAEPETRSLRAFDGAERLAIAAARERGSDQTSGLVEWHAALTLRGVK